MDAPKSLEPVAEGIKERIVGLLREVRVDVLLFER